MSAPALERFYQELIQMLDLVILRSARLLENHPALLPKPSVAEELSLIMQCCGDVTRVLESLHDKPLSKHIHSLDEIELNTAIGEVLEVIKPLIQQTRERGAELTVNLTLNDLPIGIGNPSKVRLALTNLLILALQTIPDGGELQISSQVRNNHVSTVIATTTQYMPETLRRELERIFQRYNEDNDFGITISCPFVLSGDHLASNSTDLQHGVTFIFSLPAKSDARPSELRNSFGVA
ncbi:MAG: HAMP domain-containing histidine kinase [Candidatus Tectomicrobia bacterium]|nr:HAMP domain-containing histidine kinase [Candidatus Tectomicrobia bacterium]